MTESIVIRNLSYFDGENIIEIDMSGNDFRFSDKLFSACEVIYEEEDIEFKYLIIFKLLTEDLNNSSFINDINMLFNRESFQIKFNLEYYTNTNNYSYHLTLNQDSILTEYLYENGETIFWSENTNVSKLKDYDFSFNKYLEITNIQKQYHDLTRNNMMLHKDTLSDIDEAVKRNMVDIFKVLDIAIVEVNVLGEDIEFKYDNQMFGIKLSEVAESMQKLILIVLFIASSLVKGTFNAIYGLKVDHKKIFTSIIEVLKDTSEFNLIASQYLIVVHDDEYMEI